MKSLIISIVLPLSAIVAFLGAKTLFAQENDALEASEPGGPAVLVLSDEGMVESPVPDERLAYLDETPDSRPGRTTPAEERAPVVDTESAEERTRVLDTTPAAEDPDPEAAEEPAEESTEEPADEEVDEPQPLVFDIDGPLDHDGARLESEDTITVDFPNEEIRTVLRVVADLFDLNIVIPEELTGRTSIRLRNVSWRQVFDVVLSPVGYTYVEEENIIKVLSVEALHREPPITEVHILNFARAANIREVLEPMVTPPTGRIQVDSRSNALIITERPTQMRRLRDIIERLDRSTPQVMIESKFIETTNRDLRNLGVDWTSLDGYGMRAGPFDHGYVRESFQSEARESTTDSSTGQNTTTTVTSGTTGTTMNTVTTSTAQAAAGTGIERIRGRQTSRLTTAVFSADAFDLVLSALQTDSEAKLVSNPTVVTLDNQPASIHIGEKYPLVLPRYNPQTGTYEADDVRFVDLGITLEVTPQVNAAGFINLQVDPKVSSFGGTVNYFGAEYPIEVTREASSNVTIQDGFTLALGGLVEEAMEDITSRVPVLGDIPVLGRLFRHDSKSQSQRNLIIFITAQSVSPDGTYRDIIDPRQTRRMGLTEADIPGRQYRPDIPHFPEVEVIEEDIEPEPEPRRRFRDRRRPVPPVTPTPEERVEPAPETWPELPPVTPSEPAVPAEPAPPGDVDGRSPEAQAFRERLRARDEERTPSPAPEAPREEAAAPAVEEPATPPTVEEPRANGRSPEAQERAERLRRLREEETAPNN